MAWNDSYEPEQITQYEDLKFWLNKNDSSGKGKSLSNSDDPKCPFKKLEVRRFSWDDDNTVELEDNFTASSGAFMAVPKDGHWVRLFVQANNNGAYFFQNLPERGLATGETSWGAFLKDTFEATSWQIIAFGSTGDGAFADGFIEVVLIGRPGSDPRDILTLDVDEDWGWSYQSRTQKAFTLYLDGLGGSDGSNWESEIWVSLLDYGTTGTLPNGTIVAKKNSMGRDVRANGLIPVVPNGYYWDFNEQAVISLVDDTETDFGDEGGTVLDQDPDGGDIIENDDPDTDDLKPEPASNNTLKGMYKLVKDGNADQTPFSVFKISGASDQKTWLSNDSLFINNNDTPFKKSGALLLEVREGAYVKLNIENEKKAYFTDIGTSLSLDPQLVSENFAGSDSDFTVNLYGGNLIYCDPDADYADAVSAFGAFTITTDTGSYSISDPADNDFIITLLDHGVDDREPEDNDDVVIDGDNGEGGSTTIPTDPFDGIDGLETPFDETDSLTDRVIKSTVFGINGSFRAVEAVIEGFFIALPALIVIGSAVIVGRLAINATEKGASKVVSVVKKAENSITNVSIEGVN